MELWPALVSYFHSHYDAEKPERVRTIKKLLCDETKLCLLFLDFLLPTIIAFNAAFQTTAYTTIQPLYPLINKLINSIIRCFVKLQCICTSDIIGTLYNDRSNKSEDAELQIGHNARVLPVAMEEDGQHREVQTFIDHVCFFYEAFLRTS